MQLAVFIQSCFLISKKIEFYNDGWKNFENDLCSYNHKRFFANHNNIDLFVDSFRQSEVYGPEDEIIEESENLIQKIKDGFADWIGLDWIGLDWIGLDWIGLDS